MKDFIPYPEALALKELGFDEPCFAGIYEDIHDEKYTALFDLTKLEPILNTLKANDDILRPTYSQAFRWFREKYPKLDFGVAKIYNGTNNYHYHINLQWEFFEGTYEETELACLRKLIEIVKNK